MATELLPIAGVAARCGRSVPTVRRWLADHVDFPRPHAHGPRGVAYWLPGDVDRWLARHPEIGTPPDGKDLGPADELVTLSDYARRRGLHQATWYRYRSQPGFPSPTTGMLYRLGDLSAWDASRPGQGSRSK